MIATESKQINVTTQKDLLQRLRDEFKKIGRGITNERCFDIEYDFNHERYLILKKMFRFLSYCLECQLTITDEYLEKIKLYILRDECVSKL